MTLRTYIEQFGQTVRFFFTRAVGDIFGVGDATAQIILVIIICYIALIVMLALIHRFLIKRAHRREKIFVWHMDYIYYLIARACYTDTNVCHLNVGMQSFFAKTPMNYQTHWKGIRESIQTTAKENNAAIIPEDKRDTVATANHSYHTYHQRENILGRILTIFTAGIYKVFW